MLDSLRQAIKVWHFSIRTQDTYMDWVRRFVGTVFVQESVDAARDQWRSVDDQLRDKFPKPTALMDVSRMAAMVHAR